MPSDQADMMDDADCASIASEDKAAGNGNNACSNRPARAGDPQAAGRRGLAGGGGGAGAGVKEGAATDQEEGGGRRERGRPTSALSSTPSKIGDGLSLLRIGLAGAEGFPGGEAVGGGALLLDNGEQRARQDSSRSPLPHENAAGGEDDASVLDTPLQDKVGFSFLASQCFIRGIYRKVFLFTAFPVFRASARFLFFSPRQKIETPFLVR